MQQTDKSISPARHPHAILVDDFPSPERVNPVPEQMDMSSELANQAAALVAASQPPRASFSSFPYPPHRQAPDSSLTNSEQLAILRDAYARNPNPGKRELEALAERTGRPWNKIREYFRQRRNKLRGLVDLEHMEEPGRATGWLQMTYRASTSSHVSQLNLYTSYKTRFDPCAAQTNLLGGQELIQLACATFPGCEMARDEGDYVLRGIKERGEGIGEHGVWDTGVGKLVEPIRAGTWLLSNYQHQSTPASPSSLTQTELYSTYAARFSSLPSESNPPPTEDAGELRDFEANMSTPAPDLDMSFSSDPPVPKPNRLLNPVELITLARMTFPKCEPIVDGDGRFVIRGLERREAVERGRSERTTEMFPFALSSEARPTDPNHPFTTLLKRKLGLLNPESDGQTPKKAKADDSNGGLDPNLTEEDRELLEGLKRFKGSKLGHEVGEICVNQ